MTGRTLKLAVVKADGTTEEYFHTKVMGTIANALSAAGQSDVAAAEELAEAVTFFLYRTGVHRSIGANEIFSVIKTVLASTGYEGAAVALSEHHFERNLSRCRVEVVGEKLHESTGAGGFCGDGEQQTRSRWNKSRIVEDLVGKHGLPRQTARVIASMVEEKVFNMGLPVMPASLVKQLVLNDTAAVVRAQQQLQTV
ncbi:MAG: hypothetical protein ABSG82_00805 [Sedimentisphaerales bacterium]|jgi:hypothetical protein